MSHIIIYTTEIINQTIDWIPVEMEHASKENVDKYIKENKNYVNHTQEDFPKSTNERINEKGIREKKQYSEKTHTYFEYDVSDRSIREMLNKLNSVTDMMDSLSNLGFQLKNIVSSTVHNTSIYTKYILCKTKYNNNNDHYENKNYENKQQSGDQQRPPYKKKNYGNQNQNQNQK